MKTLTDYERGFLEALIDGEGCILISKGIDKDRITGLRFKVRISITNTNKSLLEKASRMVETGTIRSILHYKGNLGSKPAYILSFFANACRWILPQLSLVNKEDKRILAIEVLDILSHRTTKTPFYGQERLLQIHTLARGRR